jgi:hypothetical protein
MLFRGGRLSVSVAGVRGEPIRRGGDVAPLNRPPTAWPTCPAAGSKKAAPTAGGRDPSASNQLLSLLGLPSALYNAALQQRIKAMRGSRKDPRYHSQVRPSPTGSRTKRGDRGEWVLSSRRVVRIIRHLAWPPLKGEPLIRVRLIGRTFTVRGLGALALPACGSHFGFRAPALWEETENQRAGAA